MTTTSCGDWLVNLVATSCFHVRLIHFLYKRKATREYFSGKLKQ